jgi:hypothetical protein
MNRRIRLNGLLNMEYRVIRFYELHKNKWFLIMNLSLEIIKTTDIKQKNALAKYGRYLFG